MDGKGHIIGRAALHLLRRIDKTHRAIERRPKETIVNLYINIKGFKRT